MTQSHSPEHHHHSLLNRGLYTLALVSALLFLGTLSFHALEGFSYIDAFYFASMIATGQGPAPSISPQTSSGKIFTCIYAFIAVGSMVASLSYLFGPFFGKLWKMGVLKVEEEIQTIKHKK